MRKSASLKSSHSQQPFCTAQEVALVSDTEIQVCWNWSRQALFHGQSLGRGETFSACFLLIEKTDIKEKVLIQLDLNVQRDLKI